MLFSSYIRDNTDHKSRKETAFEFSDRSAWKISELVRQKVDELSIDYEVDNEFLRMFKSKSDKQHYSAIFELLVYSLFTRSNFSLKKHPQTSTGKKPDFRALKGKYETLIECTLSGHSFDSLTDKNRKDTIEEIIDNIEYFPYWINLDFQTISNQSISKTKLIAFLDEVKEFSDRFTDEELIKNQYLYKNNGWELKISLFRKIQPNIKRSLGIISGDAKTIDTRKPILTALNGKKASRYGVNSEPYIICLNTSDLFTKETCFSEALFGQYGDEKINLQHIPQNGFYLADGNPINTTVSAVVIFRNFDLYTLDSSTITVWHNPYAKNKIPINLLPFDEYFYEIKNDFLQKKIIRKERDVFTILEIEKDKYIDLKNKIDN